MNNFEIVLNVDDSRWQAVIPDITAVVDDVKKAVLQEILSEIDPEREELPKDVIEQVEIEIKYEGYIERQLRQVEQYKKMEKKKIPDDLDYDLVPSLRIEARQKLKSFRPVSVGQASRISGVSPADISVLLVFLETYKSMQK